VASAQVVVLRRQAAQEAQVVALLAVAFQAPQQAALIHLVKEMWAVM
jgi:hypothetical protein